jgi:hypothetical protein
VQAEPRRENSPDRSNERVGSADPPNRRALSSLNGEQAKVRTFEILEETNRLERMRKLCELLPAVNAGNWRDVLAAFDIQLRAEGRLDIDSWDLILERIGGVAGAGVLEETLKATGPVDQHRVAWLLKGWLGEDLDGGIKWFSEQPSATQKWLVGPFATGVSRSDPQKAVEIAAQQPQSIWQVSIPFIMANAIQRSGLRGAGELLASIRTRSDIPSPLKVAAFDSAALRRIEAAKAKGEPTAILDWANQYVGPELMGPRTAREIVSFAAENDSVRTRDWVETHHGEWTPEQEATIFPEIAQSLAKQASEEFITWMNANVDHPQYGAMVLRTAKLLRANGKDEELRILADKVRDPQMRVQIDAASKKPQAPESGR